MKKVLVTGGLGFIGSNFVRFLLKKYPDLQVVNLDKETYCGNLENLEDVEGNPRYEFIRGDICDPEGLAKAMSGCSSVFNFAAQTHVDRSILNAEEFVTTNVFGTYVLLESAKRMRLEKFVQISTDEVYGSIEKGSFSEESTLYPSSPYAASKASADLLCMAYFKTYGIPILITRCTNNFGPFQYPEKLVPLFITNAIENRKLPLYGDGLNRREWVYVLDHCEAIDLLWEKGGNGEIYNIGSGHEISNKEMALTLLKELGKAESLIEYVKDRPAHDRRYSVTTKKLRSLGWEPHHSFKKALRETTLWYKDHAPWWQKLKKKRKEFQDYYDVQYGVRG
ncbi:MAG: dTDP-glucose 4,6-dehydratase [Candidatus Omnitrophica bacterium]|nr:dTDP-glucose 4,6-dehydratase [Candidatus Omnitrophota bacterium]